MRPCAQVSVLIDIAFALNGMFYSTAFGGQCEDKS